MREIKFRGKNLKGKWVYGDLLRNRGETFIAPDGIANPLATAEDFQVDPATVGQYIGLNDKNKREIYERDIVECDGSQGKCNNIIRWEFCGFWAFDDDGAGCDIEEIICSILVIGNIHDNPELLKAE